MSKYTITPWRTQLDLLEVRKQLYNTNESDTNPRRKAVDRVMAWKLRGNLPHAIESTALLVEAILHHDIKTNSIFSIRAVYSAAFSRFVTGFCDIGRHRERSLEPSSMLDIARQIGMPVEFVALRHEITHEELPGIRRLVGATSEALDWLWKVYWSRLEEPQDEKAVQAAFASMRVEAVSVLRDFRRARRDALRSKSRPASGEPGDVTTASHACVKMYGGSRSSAASLAAVVVEERLLLPSNREIGSSMDGAYLIWDELLIAVSSRLPRFVPALVRSLLGGLTRTTAMDPKGDVDKDALAMWLLHVMNSDDFMSTKGVNRDALAGDVVKWCCLYPGYWSQHVGQELFEISDKSVEADWKDLFEASLITSEGEPMENIAPAAGLFRVDEAEKGAFGEDDEVRVVSGWSKAIVPISLPIGVVQ